MRGEKGGGNEDPFFSLASLNKGHYKCAAIAREQHDVAQRYPDQTLYMGRVGFTAK